MAAKTVAKKKSHEKVKEELLNSLRENDEVEETQINIVNVIGPREATELINHYEEIIKTQLKRVLGCVPKY